MSSQYIHVLSIHVFLLIEEVFSKEFWLVSNMSRRDSELLCLDYLSSQSLGAFFDVFVLNSLFQSSLSSSYFFTLILVEYSLQLSSEERHRGSIFLRTCVSEKVFILPLYLITSNL